jgi:hypothetical protein
MKKTVFLAFLVFLFSFVILAKRANAKSSFTQDEFKIQDSEQQDLDISENSEAADTTEIEAADAAPETAAAETPAEAGDKNGITPKSFVAPLNWKIDGTIVGEQEEKILISANDTVFLDIGKDAVEPGSECTVYRKIKKVHNPRGGALLGYEVHKIAKLKVLDQITETSSNARVTVSYEPVEIGDLVNVDK